MEVYIGRTMVKSGRNKIRWLERVDLTTLMGVDEMVGDGNVGDVRSELCL